MLTISQVEETFKKILDGAKTLSVESVYELSDNKEYYRLVISFHNLIYQDVTIIHTKFYFKTNLEKTGLIDNTVYYLYDINCKYRSETYHEDDSSDLYSKIYTIIIYRKFGQDILTLSDFQLSTTKMTNYLYQKKIKDITILDVKYQPKEGMTSCDKSEFPFVISLGEDLNIKTIIKKVNDSYHLTLIYLNKYYNFNYDSITNISEIVANEIVKLVK